MRVRFSPFLRGEKGMRNRLALILAAFPKVSWGYLDDLAFPLTKWPADLAVGTFTHEWMNKNDGFVAWLGHSSDTNACMMRLRDQRFGTLLMAAMHFQGCHNYEMDRSRHYVMVYVASSGRFYPFCTWNSDPRHRYEVEQDSSPPLAR